MTPDVATVYDVPAGFQPTGFFANQIAWLADLLLTKTAANGDYKRGYWIPFGRREWIQAVGWRGYGPIAEAAVSQGLIERNQRYSPGSFSKSLRLHRTHRTGNYIPYVLAPRAKVASRSYWRIEESDFVGLWLANRFQYFSIPPNIRCANAWIDFTVRRIRLGRYYASRCRYRRYHTTFCGLPKSIRRVLTAEGRPCAEIDVSCCQPLLLSLLIGTKSSDARDFRDVCESGTFYDAILTTSLDRGLTQSSLMPSHLRHPWFQDGPLDRAHVKQSLIMVLYSRNDHMLASPIWPIIEQRWPSVAKTVLAAKQNDYRHLAHALQRSESATIIDSACNLIRLASPELPLVTIHDSIICPIDAVDTVSDALRHAFRRIGLSPMLRTKSGAMG